MDAQLSHGGLTSYSSFAIVAVGGGRVRSGGEVALQTRQDAGVVETWVFPVVDLGRLSQEKLVGVFAHGSIQCPAAPAL